LGIVKHFFRKDEKMKKILIYDSTLRDGAQAQGISFSVEDKLKIVERLDRLGISYIEAGNRAPTKGFGVF